MKKLIILMGVLFTSISTFALPFTFEDITQEIIDGGYGDSPYIPLHNPIVEGITNHEIPESADALNSQIGMEQIRTYVQVNPSDSTFFNGSVRFIFGNAVTINDSLLTAGFGQPTGLVDDPSGTIDETFRLRLVNIYDFGGILTLADSTVTNSDGAEFYAESENWNLPGGFNVDDSVESQLTPYDLSKPHNSDPDYQTSFRPLNHSVGYGIDAGEWSSVSFLYSANSNNLSEFINDIEKIFVGFHAQAFSTDDYSAAFYTHMPLGVEDVQPVPEPGTVMLLGTGLLGLVAYKRKFKG